MQTIDSETRNRILELMEQWRNGSGGFVDDLIYKIDVLIKNSTKITYKSGSIFDKEKAGKIEFNHDYTRLRAHTGTSWYNIPWYNISD